MDAKFGDLQGVAFTRQYASGLAECYNGSAIRTTQTGKGQAQREEDAEQGELDLNSGNLF